MRFSDHLRSLFPLSTSQNWLDRIGADLKGNPIDALHWEPILGHRFIPFFNKEIHEREGLPHLPANNPWEIGEDIHCLGELDTANTLALLALEGGAQSLRFVCGKTIELNAGNLTGLLKDIDYSLVSLHFQTPDARMANDLAKALPVILGGTDLVRGSIGITQFDFSEEGLLSFASKLEHTLPGFKWAVTVGEDGFSGDQQTPQDLAVLLGKAAACLEMLTTLGLPAHHLTTMIQLSIPIGLDYFVNIAKIRALKCLWGNVLAAHGLPPSPPFVDAYLARQTLTADPNKNMLQATTQAMSAIIGGANRLTIPAFESQNERFGRRIARNIQHIAQLESHLDWVSDPAAGSYFMEELTAAIMEEAWAAFVK